MLWSDGRRGELEAVQEEGRERIDGIVALITALDRASRQEKFRSVYDKRGSLSSNRFSQHTLTVKQL